MNNRYNFYNLEALFAIFLDAVNEKSAANDKKLSSISKKNYLSDFRFFSGWYTAHYDLSQFQTDAEAVQAISEKVLQNFFEYMLDSPLPTQTINRRLSSLRKFFEFAMYQNWIQMNLAKKINNVREEEAVIHTKNIREALAEYSATLPDEKLIIDLKDYFITVSQAHAHSTL